jgi:predicted nuclease of predicted toxin-antitoxin system
VRFETGLLVPAIRRIPAYAAAHDFILVSTDSDFEGLLRQIPGAKIVILRSCDFQPMLRPRCFDAMRSVSLSCPVPKIV